MRIEVNLLPPSYFEAKKRQQMILLGIAGGGLALALIVAFNVMKFIQANSLAKQIQAVEAEQKKYETVLVELERIRSQQAQVEEREKLVKDLIKFQIQWPQVLVNFAKAIPATVWISSMKSTDGGKRSFTLEGRAISKQAVVDFLRNIQIMPGIEMATINQIVETGTGSSNTSFLISFTVTM